MVSVLKFKEYQTVHSQDPFIILF